MNATKDDRAREIHERARKIQQEIGSDLYRVEDYHDIARRLIEQEEDLDLPVNPYPLNEEAQSGRDMNKEGQGKADIERKRRN